MSTKSKKEEELYAVKMLHLKLPTDPRWVNLAEMDLEEILTDHAYCEQKAATACISLIQQYPEKEELVRKLAPIVTEEWGHFRTVIKEMDSRGLKLGRQRKDLYVNRLLGYQVKGVSKEEKLLDRLLICALIEARSCERFRLLSLHIGDDHLKDFYHTFMMSEAGHYVLFIDLARKYFGRERADQRWQEFLEYEAEIMDDLELRGDRMH
ncbi:MAG TPA: tRNA-(ms[2]io[6]A)-hydroxylase [Saprospiraceae bacterium]|nr:tRNA-(ms[2]io[6]A)-hydroxylase [Saprospiraceae bacterium]